MKFLLVSGLLLAALSAWAWTLLLPDPANLVTTFVTAFWLTNVSMKKVLGEGG